MQNFFDYQVYEIETGFDIIRSTVFLKIGANKYIRSHFELQNTTITLTDQFKSDVVFNTINITNCYLEFNIHVCMGRGVSVQQSNKEIQIYGLSSQIIQILKLYGVQKNFAEQYKVLKQIGKGSYGKVYKVINVESSLPYAVKMFEKQLLLDQRDQQAILKEIQILRLMNHPNVVSMKECFESDQCLFLVVELFEGKLVIDENNPLKDDRAIKLLLKLLSGLDFIHSKHIIHRDLKPDNILLRSNGEPVIADFGLADFYDPAGHYLFSKCGTRGYVAPEMMTTNNYDYKVDIYSLGVVFHQLITGRVPNPWENFKLSSEQLSLLIGMLHSNPINRFSINEIKQNKYIRRIIRRSQIFNIMGSITDVPKELSINNQEIDTKPFSLNSIVI